LLPWYVDPAVIEPSAIDRIGTAAGDRVPAPRSARHRNPGPRNADDVHLQIKGFISPGSVTPGSSVDFRMTVDPPKQLSVDIYRIGHYSGDGAAHITTSPRLSGIVQPTQIVAG